jgi:hypothetical protein
LTQTLQNIRLGCGHLRVLHYLDEDGNRGVVSCWPSGVAAANKAVEVESGDGDGTELMGPAVGNAKKVGRRLWAVVYGSGQHFVAQYSPIGFVAHSEVVNNPPGSTSPGFVSATYPEPDVDGNTTVSAQLPAGKVVTQFDVERLPTSWAPGWQESAARPPARAKREGQPPLRDRKRKRLET